MSGDPRLRRPLHRSRRTRAAAWAAVAVSTMAMLLADGRLAFGNHGLTTWAVEVCAIGSLGGRRLTLDPPIHVASVASSGTTSGRARARRNQSACRASSQAR